ncbi:putative sugar kinase YdjE [Paenibacillus baekrokdamisoli]|uniref:Putative sugar kinase YdjE n=1 Tax=Paenibacillus baekrokdamisoli TaxID=1712516 RepID=A0A3G9JDU9_9BACL|nr:sugar kinase [Paenibacillus baekrokdamisoli]MBB3071946.1 fructokinase [Paenibacillus baekrokdamisoli]BBH24071.1 putative sugar kinase YdjE [Paenibacillus baekrokdamisoli]
MFGFDDKIEFQKNNNDILTVGEILIDMISTEYGDNFESSTYNKLFGGSPSNIAMNVKKLGIHSLVASAVGKDGLGTFLINQLRNADIDTNCVQRTDYPTSLVVLTKSKSSPTPIFYRGADYHLAFTPVLEEYLINSKIVHFSCWPISMVPVRHSIEKVIEKARENHILIGFDPNYHPMIWQRGEDGIRYVKSIIGKVDIIKPSEDDAERLFGKDTHENQIRKFLELGAKLVIMTLGKEGAIVSNGIETVKYNALATDVVDTTGAGDAFWSGFYTAAIKGYTIRESLALGFAVSAYQLKYTGAIVDLPKLEVIKERYGL